MNLPESVSSKFDVFDWRHASALLSSVRPDQLREIVDVLSAFELRWSVLAAKGENNAVTATLLGSGLYQKGWIKKRFDTRILIDDVEVPSPTHRIDCYKNGVALEVEWNNKVSFFDRDLNNFRLLHSLRVVDVAVIVTRSTALQKWCRANHTLLNRTKAEAYGASTTHFDKLKPKVEGGGAGGCPVLVFSIRQEAYINDRPGV